MLYVYVITASVLVHLALLPVWVFWLSAKGLFEAGPVRTVCEKARQVAEAQRPCESALSCAEQRMQVALLEEAPDPEEKEKKEPEIVDMQTVVAPKDVEESEPPVDAKLASTVDSSVEKESVAKSDHYGLTSGASSPTVAKATTASQSRSREQEVGERAEHDPEQGKSVDVPELTEDDGGKKGVQAEPIDPLDDGKKGPDIVLPDFDSERLAAVGSDGGTVDYLNGVDEDNKTLLNRKRMSYADYLALEGSGQGKHEWLDGEILAMTGASPRHVLVTMNLGAALHRGLRGGPCRAWCRSSSSIRRAPASSATPARTRAGATSASVRGRPSRWPAWTSPSTRSTKEPTPCEALDGCGSSR